MQEGVQIEDHRCFLYNSRHESAKHLFVECQEVKQVWRELNLKHVRQQLAECNSVGETLDSLWKQSEKVRM